MPNRILKESICSSDSINGLTPFEEVFFYRLIVNCDDYGRFDARTAILKARLFPLKERISLKDIESARVKLADIGCVRLYEVDSKPYLYLPAWEVHQNVRAKKSKYPQPNEETEKACDLHKITKLVSSRVTIQTLFPLAPNSNFFFTLSCSL